MGKEEIEMDLEHTEEKQSSSIDKEDEEVESLEVESEVKEKHLMS